MTDIHIRTKAEAYEIAHIRCVMESGFLPKSVALACSILMLAALILYKPIAVWLLIPLLADYIFFKVRRVLAIEAFKTCPTKILTLDDWQAVEQAYRDRGIPQPTMADTLAVGRDHSPDSLDKTISDYRYQVIADYINTRIKPQPLIADIGCGDAYFYKFLTLPPLWYVPVDVMKDLLELAIKNTNSRRGYQASGDNLPFVRKIFDYVVCTESLEHIANYQRAVREFARVVKPDGRILMTFPNAHRIRNYNIVHAAVDLTIGRLFPGLLLPVTMHPNLWVDALTHHYDFSLGDVKRMARGAGLEIERLTTINFPSVYKGVLRHKRVFNLVEGVLSRLPFVKYGGRSWFVVMKKRGTI